jgi:hypothetical protein
VRSDGESSSASGLQAAKRRDDMDVIVQGGRDTEQERRESAPPLGLCRRERLVKTTVENCLAATGPGTGAGSSVARCCFPSPWWHGLQLAAFLCLRRGGISPPSSSLLCSLLLVGAFGHIPVPVPKAMSGSLDFQFLGCRLEHALALVYILWTICSRDVALFAPIQL